MNLINFSMTAGFLLKVLNASTTSSLPSTSANNSQIASSSAPTTISATSLATTSTTTSASVALPAVVSNLPTQAYFINTERPLMINQINLQRSGMKNPLLCQDSLLTSIAQQHANDMAALDMLEHNLPCTSSAFPVQFCSSSQRLEPFGQSAENLAVLPGNNGSAATALAQLNTDAGQFSNMMNPDFMYIGIGMAMNPVSGKYYWTQVFSTGNYQGVSCTLQPSVTVLDAYNRTHTTVQPIEGLNLGVYPKGISKHKKKGLFCTLIPFAHGKGTSDLPLGKLPYPTITMVPFNSSAALKQQITGIIGAFAAALSQANATIIGPSSLKLFPMKIVSSTEVTSSSITPTSVTSANPGSMLAAFTPSNASQSSVQAAMSAMMVNPSMSAAAAQMAQFMAMANTNSTSTSLAAAANVATSASASTSAKTSTSMLLTSVSVNLTSST